MGKFCVGIDLGGTFIKFALLDRQMQIAASMQVPTPAAGADAVIDAMAAGALELMRRQSVDKGDVAALGIGSPGPLDLEAGVVLALPNIPGFENVALRDRVGGKVGLPAVLENDANAAGLGEYLRGGGKGARIMVLLTLGTGVGSGIVIDGVVLHGAHGIGAEVGHMIVCPGGEPCGCGQKGCLERYSSATYLARLARRAVEQGHRGVPKAEVSALGSPSSLSETLASKGDIDARDVEQAWRAGDELGAQIWEQAMHYLGVACVNLARTLDPDLIVLGGGMARAGDALLEPVRRHFRALHWTVAEPKTEIVLARLGNDAGVIGAAGVAWEKYG